MTLPHSLPLLERDPGFFERHHAAGWFESASIAERVAVHAAAKPDATAFVSESGRTTWAEYDERATRLGAALAGVGLTPGDRLAVLLPDGSWVHTAFVAAEKAGVVVVGIGPRAGVQEVRHLLDRTGARSLLTASTHRGAPATDLVAELDVDHHIVVPLDGDDPLTTAITIDGKALDLAAADGALLAGRGLGPDDVFLLNSTSGTTGLPKCVLQHQNRWIYFHHLAREAGALGPDDVFMSVVPAPFGFGLWTAHVTPTVLGAPCVVTERFSAATALELIERERVSVLACVSTQFIMMLNDPTMGERDLTSLRVMFTGGEAVPYERAAAFEANTGAAVLQFFGSNETGALSRTALTDTRDQRLRSAGRVIDEMEVRLLDDDGTDVTARGGPGQPACRGPATCLGYLDDDAANAELFTADGWMRTGDIATVDGDGYLAVVGRKSDIIIRGGKNVSAAQVETEVGTHPSVAMVAAVAKPDATFGERVCVFVELRAGTSLHLDALVGHLKGRGCSPELLPEDLVVVDALPRASGGKVAKGELRARLSRVDNDCMVQANVNERGHG